STGTRHPSFPDVPSASVAGLPDYDFITWYGLMAPAGTPPEIVARLNKEVAAALTAPDVKQRLDTLGVEAKPSSPEEFAEFMKRESEKLGKIIKQAGLN